MPASGKFSIFATVGTDFHQFDRLIAWVDEWCSGRNDVECLVQHGMSSPPARSAGVDFLSREELAVTLAHCDVVVCHGGPATIADARGAGRLPICVPRDPVFREHVDGHQQRFARRVAQDDLVVLAESKAALFAALDRARVRPEAFLLPGSSGSSGSTDLPPAVDRAGVLIAQLLERSSTGPGRPDALRS
jgi:UDP-N-acetylglucosamine transferase subunit ALG13